MSGIPGTMLASESIQPKGVLRQYDGDHVWLSSSFCLQGSFIHTAFYILIAHHHVEVRFKDLSFVIVPTALVYRSQDIGSGRDLGRTSLDVSTWRKSFEQWL